MIIVRKGGPSDDNTGTQRICSSKYLFLWNLWLANSAARIVRMLRIFVKFCYEYYYSNTKSIRRIYSGNLEQAVLASTNDLNKPINFNTCIT